MMPEQCGSNKEEDDYAKQELPSQINKSQTFSFHDT